MNPALTALMLLIAAAVFAFTMTRRVVPLFALRRDVRTDRVGERVRALLRFGFGQKRLVDPEERRPGVMHVVIFAAFLVLAVQTITLFGVGFSDGFHLPLLGPGSALGDLYLFVKDVMVLAAIVAVAGFVWRRVVTKPDRVTLSTEGVVILFFIAGLMVTDLLFDGAELVARGEPGSWATPAGSLGAAILEGSGLGASGVHAVGLAAFWLHLALILVFGNVLPYGKHFHIITGLPNVFFARLPPLAALRKLDLEAEDASFGAATVKDLSWKEAWDV